MSWQPAVGGWKGDRESRLRLAVDLGAGAGVPPVKLPFSTGVFAEVTVM